MPWVRRDAQGRIEAVFAHPETPEEIPADSPELAAFVLGDDDTRSALRAMDLELVRVLEDLIAVMIEKKQIALTDLPREAQAKLMRRKSLRGSLGHLVGLMDDGDIL